MDFGEALGYIFRQKEWPRKVLVAALYSLIPVFGQVLVFGWSLGITKRMLDGEEELLVNVDVATDLLRGLKGWGLSLAYSLPGLFLGMPLAVGILLGISGWRSALTWLLAGLCLMTVVVLYYLAMGLALPAAFGQFLDNDERFMAGLDLRAVFARIRRSPANYFLVMIGQVICLFITFFGVVGCVVGVVFSSLYTLLVMAHLYAQAYFSAE